VAAPLELEEEESSADKLSESDQDKSRVIGSVKDLSMANGSEWAVAGEESEEDGSSERLFQDQESLELVATPSELVAESLELEEEPSEPVEEPSEPEEEESSAEDQSSRNKSSKEEFA